MIDINIDSLVAHASDVLNVPADIVLGRSQHKQALRARAAVSFILFQCGYSQVRIGKEVGRDRTTVMSALRRAEAQISKDPLFARQVSDIQERALAGLPPNLAAKTRLLQARLDGARKAAAKLLAQNEQLRVELKQARCSAAGLRRARNHWMAKAGGRESHEFKRAKRKTAQRTIMRLPSWLLEKTDSGATDSALGTIPFPKNIKVKNQYQLHGRGE